MFKLAIQLSFACRKVFVSVLVYNKIIVISVEKISYDIKLMMYKDKNYCVSVFKISHEINIHEINITITTDKY